MANVKSILVMVQSSVLNKKSRTLDNSSYTGLGFSVSCQANSASIKQWKDIQGGNVRYKQLVLFLVKVAVI